jgi:NADPH:quinone reductase-like Zn-dependent oxidoreductase
MRAMALRKYGHLEDMEKIELPLPEPKKGEVRVRVHASALNPADYKVGLGQVKFLRARRFPMVLGNDFSGVIEAVGENSDWKIGESVFGFLPYGPFNRKGAFAETLIARTDEIASKPPGVSHIQAAAAATPGLTAIQGIRDAGKLSSSGGRVLITGVSGGVGSVAVSIAGKLGALVVAVGSGRGITLAKQLGASDMIDRKHQDVFASSGTPFDVVFDAAAAYRWKQWKGKLKSGGMYVTTLPSLPFLADKLRSVVAASGAAMVSVKSKPSDLRLLGSWLDSGLVITIDSIIPVREAAVGLAKLQRGEVTGRMVVDVINGF